MTQPTQTETPGAAAIWRPISFKPELVRAILDGKKTQTRRVIKPQPGPEAGLGLAVNPWQEKPGPTQAVFFRGPTVESPSVGQPVKCRYGRPGDYLWVKESWAAIWPGVDPAPLAQCNFEYKADALDQPYPAGWDRDTIGDADGDPRWKSAMFMPRVVSRISLRIEDIQVQQVQAISEADAQAEGVDRSFRVVIMHPEGFPDYSIPLSYRGGFCNTWQKINEGPLAWEHNPWVWVVKFSVVDIKKGGQYGKGK